MAGSVLADSAREGLGEGLGKMEGAVRKVLTEGIKEGLPKNVWNRPRGELSSA